MWQAGVIIVVILMLIGMCSDGDDPTVGESASAPAVASTPKSVVETRTTDLEKEVASAAVRVDELSCPEPVDVDLQYVGAVPVRQIAADLVKKWGLKHGPLDAIPTDATFSNFYWVFAAEHALTILARDADWTWYLDGGTIRFVKRDDPALKTAGHVATRFDLKATPADGGLMVTIDTDLADGQTIKVGVSRTYFEIGSATAYSSAYFDRCGLAAQWRVQKFIPVDDEVWKADMIAHQDKMARLGKGVAFDIGEISDHVKIGARSRSNKAEAEVLLPLTVSIRSKTNFVSWNNLEFGESYELLGRAHLMPRMSSTTERGRPLAAGEIIRIEGIADNHRDPWYLVTVDGRQGWVNSIALMSEGAKRVSTLTARERTASQYHQDLMENVFTPCMEYAYSKVVKGKISNEQVVRLAMFENVVGPLDDLVADLMDMEDDLKLLSERDIREFHGKSLANCKLGVG